MPILDSLTVTRAAAYRTPAWMGLGNVFNEPVTDYKEMLRLSSLDQIVITEEEINVSGGDARFIVPVKGFVALDITTGERKVLGIVGQERTLFTPAEIFEFLEDLNGAAAWEIAGTLRDDRTVFGALRLEKEITLPGQQPIVTYLGIATAMDGTMPLSAFVTPIRPECQNTLTSGMRAATQSFKIRQTKNARDRMAVKAETFRKANDYVAKWEIAMREMLDADYSDRQFDRLITDVMGERPKENVRGNLTKYDDKRDAHLSMWNADHNSEIKGTAYGAWNVLCEVQQWGRQEREGSKGSEAFYMSGAGFDSATEKDRTAWLNMVRKRAGLALV